MPGAPCQSLSAGDRPRRRRPGDSARGPTRSGPSRPGSIAMAHDPSNLAARGLSRSSETGPRRARGSVLGPANSRCPRTSRRRRSPQTSQGTWHSFHGHARRSRQSAAGRPSARGIAFTQLTATGRILPRCLGSRPGARQCGRNPLSRPIVHRPRQRTRNETKRAVLLHGLGRWVLRSIGLPLLTSSGLFVAFRGARPGFRIS